MEICLPKTCWVVTDGKVGTQNACLGLAEALQMTPIVKHLTRQGLNAYLPEALGRFLPSQYLVRGLRSDLDPWPEILITSGRPSVAVSLAIKRLSKNRTFTIHVQDPRLSPDLFDVVIAPQHDQISSDNVISLTGTLHRINLSLCTQEAEAFLKQSRPNLPSLTSKTLMAILIGGPNGLYAFGQKEASSLIESLKALAVLQKDLFFLITVSRRTSQEVFSYLQEACASMPGYIWDNTGSNPYMAFLGLADLICVTSDSVAMVSEACATGKPVYIIELPKKRSTSSKFDIFHEQLRLQNHTRPFKVPLEEYTPIPLDEKQMVQHFVTLHFKRWVQARGTKNERCKL